VQIGVSGGIGGIGGVTAGADGGKHGQGSPRGSIVDSDKDRA